MKYIILLLAGVFILSCGSSPTPKKVKTETIYPSDTSFTNNIAKMRITLGVENFWTLPNSEDKIISTITKDYNGDKKYTLGKTDLEKYQIMFEGLDINGSTIARGITNIINVNKLENSYPIFLAPINQSISLASTDTGIDESVKNLVGHTLTNLPDGRVLIWGGRDSSGKSTSKVFVYSPGKQAAISLTANSPRAFHTATLYYLDYSDKNNPKHPRVLISGGMDNSNYITEPEVFNPEDNSIIKLNGPEELLAKINQSAIATRNGFIYLFGGRYLTNGNEEYSSDIISFNTIQNTFSILTQLPKPVENTTATYVGDGKIIIAGGNDANNVYKLVFLFDSSAPSKSYEIGNMNNKRTMHKAIFHNDKVYFIGGFSEHTGNEFSGAVKDIESATKSGLSGSTLCYLKNGRGRFTANLVNANTIIITGGDNGDKTPIKESELIELKTKSCMPSTKTISLNSPRYSSKSILTSTGLTLIVGGTAGNLSSATPIEVINVIP